MRRRQCTATNAAGEPCGRNPQRGKTVCTAHDPDPAVQQAFQQTQFKGLLAAMAADRSTGEALADLPRLDTSDGRVEAIQKAYTGLMTGTLSVAKAKAVPALVRAAAEERSPGRLGALEQQVADLLEAVARKERGAPWG